MMMRRRKRFSTLVVLLLVLCVALLTVSRNGVAAVEQQVSKNDDDTDKENPIQENPDYQPPSRDDDDDSDDSDEYDEYDDEEEDGREEDSLAKSVREKSKSKKKKSLIKVLRKNKGKILLGLTCLAFRQEIAKVVWMSISRPSVLDEKTGEVVERSLYLTPTNALKLFVFILIMLELMKKRDGAEGDSSDRAISAVVPILSTIFMPSPVAAAMWLGSSGSNSAYVPPIKQHWTFEKLHDRYQIDTMALDKALNVRPAKQKVTHGSSSMKKNETVSSSSFVKELLARLRKTSEGTEGAPTSTRPPVAIVMDLRSWYSARSLESELDSLRDQVSFLISQHRKQREVVQKRKEEEESTEKSSEKEGDRKAKEVNQTANVALRQDDNDDFPTMEIVLLLDSPGGSATEFGLAAAQLQRLKDEPGMTLTVCVDKVAASGGYMMACVGHKLLAAPWALLGSIGVLTQHVTVHEALQGWGIQTLTLKAGEKKVLLDPLGPITPQAKQVTQDKLHEVHAAFQHHVTSCRPVLGELIKQVATGDVWMGNQALELQLVDQIQTSDAYIADLLGKGIKVLKLIPHEPSSLSFLFPSGKTSGWAQTLGHVIRHQVHSLLRNLSSSIQRLIESSEGPSIPLRSAVRTGPRVECNSM